MNSIRDTVALRAIPGVGDRLFLRLVRRFGSASGALAAAAGGVGFAADLLPAAARRAAVAIADRDLAAARRLGARFVILGDPDYPPGLAALADPPPALRVLGEVRPGDVNAVAVVGARDASAYGLSMASLLARELATAGVTVVSGLALGIDAAAHRGALEAGGRTIAVLGSALDRLYPARHGRLAREIAASGAVVSELPFGAGPEVGHFPRRNRIVAGLALAVVVVEATEKSGSLITARLATEQGREVFAVPGEANAPRTRGTHGLLRDGAALAERGRDVVAGALPWLLENESKTRQGDRFPVLEADLAKMLDALEPAPTHVDEILARSGFSAARALEILLELELRGLARRGPGMTYTREAP